MKFDVLDKKMRVFETSHDHCVLPGLYMIARLDGRNFSKLTKKVQKFEAPFDSKFRDLMIETVTHLMDCGIRTLYGYTQSDEISLLLHPKDSTFGRKLRKYNSVLASEASAKFSLLLGGIGCFDCRISQLPTWEFVLDYFHWRQEDAHRNSLSSHCYWMLRKQGISMREATDALDKKSSSYKSELLSQNGINFDELPLWQKRGVGFYWENYEAQGINPQTKEEVTYTRRRVARDLEIPMKEEYQEFLTRIVQ